LYFVTQWRRTKPKVYKPRLTDKLIAVRGAGWIQPWTPVNLTDGNLTVAGSSAEPHGVVVPYSIGNSVLLNGSHEFSDYGVPKPEGSWLGRDNDDEEWVWSITKPSQVVARIFQNYIIKETHNMGYAIGSRDISDVRDYASQTGSAFGSFGPIIGMPVKPDGSAGIAPATAADENIIGIVKEATETSSGSGVYDVVVQVAEGDFKCTHSFSSSDYGQPLFVGLYPLDGSSELTVNDMYSTSEPSTGFSHALLTAEPSKCHYNGNSRPVAL
jgi:hypothetical protein